MFKILCYFLKNIKLYIKKIINILKFWRKKKQIRIETEIPTRAFSEEENGNLGETD